MRGSRVQVVSNGWSDGGEKGSGGREEEEKQTINDANKLLRHAYSLPGTILLTPPSLSHSVLTTRSRWAQYCYYHQPHFIHK